MVAASRAAMVDVDELGDVAELSHLDLVAGMIAPRTTVKEHQGGPLDHSSGTGRQSHAVDVEVDLGSAYPRAHPRSP